MSLPHDSRPSASLPGASTHQIADNLGFSAKSAAYQAVQRGLKDPYTEDVDGARGRGPGRCRPGPRRVRHEAVDRTPHVREEACCRWRTVEGTGSYRPSSAHHPAT